VIIKAAALALLLATAACGGGQAADDATEAATRFEQAVHSKDFGAACALLSPEVQQSLDDCAAELKDAELPATSGAAASAVYGQNGIVRWPTDTLFVSRFPGGWRVIAAGCVSRPDRPYDCSVSGG
jgi:hypothetical protein